MLIISWGCSFLDSIRKQIHIVVSPVLQKNLIPYCPSALPYRFPSTPSFLTRGLRTLFIIAYSRHALHLVLFYHFFISSFHFKILVLNWTIRSHSRIERVIHGVVWGPDRSVIAMTLKPLHSSALCPFLAELFVQSRFPLNSSLFPLPAQK